MQTSYPGAPEEVWTRAAGDPPPAPADPPPAPAEGDEPVTVDSIVAALQAIVEQAQAASRSLTDAEMERYERLEVRKNQLVKAQQIQLRHAALVSVTTVPVPPGSTSTKVDDTLERAFDSYLRTGRENADLTQLRTQTEGVLSQGGYTVPETLRQKLTERLKSFGGLASVVEEFTTSSGEPIRWPSVDDTTNAAVIVAEGAAPASGGADIVFGEVSLGAFSYQAPGAGNEPLEVTLELLQDSAFDIQGLIRRTLGTRIGRTQAAHWVTGVGGTTAPDGITNAAAHAGGPTYTAAGVAPTFADIVAITHTVDPDYRDNARWAFNDQTWAKFEGIVDSNGRPLVGDSTDSITGKAVPTLRGYPVVIDQAFPDYTDDTTNAWGVFGDLHEGYVIRRIKDVELIVDPYTAANNRKVKYTLWARADGTVQNKFAYAVLSNGEDA